MAVRPRRSKATVPADHAADLAGVIRALGLKRPAVLGHSMGVASTLVLAGLYPELPRAILLEDPPPWWITAEAGVPLTRHSPIRLGIIELKRKTREELIAHARSGSPTWPEAELVPGPMPSCGSASTSSPQMSRRQWIGRPPCGASPVRRC